MKKFATLALSLALILMVVSALGCSKKAVSSGPAEPVTPPPPETEVETTTPPEQVQLPPEPEKLELEDVFFDFDKAALRPEARTTLSQNAEMLQRHHEARILIEGHCDERGTREYNLALGDKRAKAAMDFLVRYGIEPARIETISYGEERPFAMGQNESAWALNRRVHFVIRN